VGVRCRNATQRRISSVKKAAPLATCTKEGQRSVICFLSSEVVKPITIQRRLKVQYGDACLSLQQVYEWTGKFMNGSSSVTDSPRRGQAHRVVTPEAIAADEAIVKENRRVTVNEIAAHQGMSHGSAHHIVHDVLQFHKVSARWVPRQLTVELKERRVDASQELLKRFEAEGDGFLGRIGTGDETCVHLHQPKTKKTSKEWRHTYSPKLKKIRTQPSAGKVMLTVFWDERGVIWEHYMPRGNTVTSATYADLLKSHLRPAIKFKRRGRLSTGVLLQHDNARPHTARSTLATIQDLSFECLPHPPYSPDIAPSDFHVFGPLTEAMGGKSFGSDEEVQQAVHEWLRSQPKEFFSRGIHALPKRWNICMERSGYYMKK